MHLAAIKWTDGGVYFIILACIGQLQHVAHGIRAPEDPRRAPAPLLRVGRAQLL